MRTYNYDVFKSWHMSFERNMFAILFEYNILFKEADVAKSVKFYRYALNIIM